MDVLTLIPARGRCPSRHVGEIEGEGLSLGGVWTAAEAAKHFDLVYEFENDNPRCGNVSINSEVYRLADLSWGRSARPPPRSRPTWLTE
jgi:hypothetical protein